MFAFYSCVRGCLEKPVYFTTRVFTEQFKTKAKNFVIKGFQSLGEHTFVGIAHTYIVCKFENNRMKCARNIDF